MPNSTVNMTVMLKDGGYENVKIPTNYIGKLAESIWQNGFEWLTLKRGPIAVVGFMVTGKQTGERVIIIGNQGLEEPKDD